MTPADQWNLVVAASARRDLERLPHRAALSTLEFMNGELLRSPRRVGRALQRELLGLHSARRGPYRVVYEIRPEDHTVVVVRIGHRSDVYRPT